MPSMHAIFVDIGNELTDVAREADHLRVALTRCKELKSDEQELWEQTHMLASAIEKIYTGCERVMAKVASEYDGASVSRSDDWHVALLKRLAHPFPPTREAVLSPLCFAGLDRLRAFRHRERNSYGIDLDSDIVRERAHEAVETFRRFASEVVTFMGLAKPSPPSNA